ncbi:MAG: PaaI family thioesterase [Alphaproteobacteria bacterium]|nr:PaaI family thioesterase [Alphaproteobacteria bacterium]
MPKRTEAELETMIEQVMAIPLHRHLGLELVEREEGRARLRFRAGPAALTNVGSVHGGVLSLLLEPAALLALLPMLDAGESAATVDVHVAFPAAPEPGHWIELEGRVIRRARQLAFCEAEARSGGRLCAAARLTKAVLTARM